MYKFLLAMMACVISVSIAAQTTLFGTSSSKKTPLPKAGTVMSPEDFQNQVSKMGQANSDALNQQVESTLKKMPASPTSPMPAAPSKATPAEAPLPAAPGGMEQQPAPAQVYTAPAPAEPQQVAPVSPPPAPQQPQAQPYTGFQGNGSTTPAPSSNEQSGGGWNIKY